MQQQSSGGSGVMVNAQVHESVPVSVRLGAKFFDVVIAWSPLLYIVVTGNSNTLFMLGAIGFFLIYVLTADCLIKGQSIGKLTANLVVISTVTGQPCGFAESVIRNIPMVFLVFLPSAFMLFNPVGAVIMGVLSIIGLMDLYTLMTKRRRLGDIFANTDVLSLG